MTPEGRVRVLVRTRKVPVGTVDISTPTFSASGIFMGIKTKRAVLYGSSLDPEHQRAIDEGLRLSNSLGLPLEVVDTSKGSLFRRAVTSLSRNGSQRPAIMVAPFMPQAQAGVSCDAGAVR